MKDMQIGDVYGGFVLKKVTVLQDIESTAYEFVHNKTKTPALYIKNKDKEATFGVGFYTPALNHKGTTHILEHCVLAGSENFAVRDPFVQILKTSDVAYVNAMTYPDRTVYPVSTTNKKEYKKLMHIYLDAVFKPLVKTNKGIFLQEGWRFEKTDTGYKHSGVVYNEMKGSLADPRNLVEDIYLAKLYPKTTYKNNSGGVPEHIVDLSHKELVNYHDRYYNPSNARLFFYGDTDIKKHLQFIDKNYLQDSTYHKPEKFEFQKPATKKVFSTEKYYSESSQAQTLYCFAASVGLGKQLKQRMGMQLLATILSTKVEGTLYGSLVKSGLVDSVEVYLETDVGANSLVVIAASNKKRDAKKIQQVIETTLQSMAEQGIDEQVFAATKNTFEFGLNYANTKTGRGVKYLQEAFSNWNYGWGPVDVFAYNQALQGIKKAYVEKILRTQLVENAHAVFIELTPSKDRKFDHNYRTDQKLKKQISKLSAAKQKAIEQDTDAFMAYKCQPEADTELSKFKLLKQKDLLTEYKDVAHKVLSKNEVSFKTKDKDISMFVVAFPTDHIDPKHFAAVQLLGRLLVQVPTDNWSEAELATKIKTNLGLFSFAAQVHSSKNHQVKPTLRMQAAWMNQYQPAAMEVIAEVLQRSDFTVADIKRVLKSEISNTAEDLTGYGHLFALNRASAGVSSYHYYSDLVAGVGYLEFLRDLQKQLQSKPDQVLADLQDLYQTVFTQKSPIMVYGSHKNLNKDVAAVLSKTKKQKTYTYDQTLKEKSEGLSLGGPVNYNAFAGKVSGYDRKPCRAYGIQKLVEKVARMSYLWQEIREKGGAYGTGLQAWMQGVFVAWSYRDPQVEQSYKTFAGVKKFLQKLSLSEQELLDAKISVMSKVNGPISDAEVAQMLLGRLVTGRGYDQQQALRKEIVSAKVSDLHKFGQQIETKGIKVTLGNAKAVKGYFKKTRDI